MSHKEKELSQVEKTALRLKRQQVKREVDNIRNILLKREEDEVLNSNGIAI